MDSLLQKSKSEPAVYEPCETPDNGRRRLHLSNHCANFNLFLFVVFMLLSMVVYGFLFKGTINPALVVVSIGVIFLLMFLVSLLFAFITSRLFRAKMDIYSFAILHVNFTFILFIISALLNSLFKK